MCVCVCVCVTQLYSSSWLIEKGDWLLRALWCVWSPLSCWPPHIQSSSLAETPLDSLSLTLFYFSLSLYLSVSLHLSLYPFVSKQDWSAEHCGGCLMPLALRLCLLLFLSPAYLSLSLAVTHLTKPGWHDQSWVAMVTVPLVWRRWRWQCSVGLRVCLQVHISVFSGVWVAKWRWCV